jgi:hypothetical protein
MTRREKYDKLIETAKMIDGKIQIITEADSNDADYIYKITNVNPSDFTFEEYEAILNFFDKYSGYDKFGDRLDLCDIDFYDDDIAIEETDIRDTYIPYGEWHTVLESIKFGAYKEIA